MANSGQPVAAVAALLASTVILLLLAPAAVHAITCQDTARAVAGCIAYGRTGGRVPPACCTGVRNLNSGYRATPDRQQICRCLLALAKSIPGINMDNIARVPSTCGVNLGFPVSLSVDCSKVK